MRRVSCTKKDASFEPVTNFQRSFRGVCVCLCESECSLTWLQSQLENLIVVSAIYVQVEFEIGLSLSLAAVN